ncbi:uncharacterized protein ASCRUDRAFT_78100 [Ascoidea rubescens DSM 1968]|uniref:Uncharacterized protein n=1 Tax=Ascoidea rubescens DSM 1968 TaxID=1344418 RepID=A0A1D2V9E9_9ASCO|nr:hypothetical protein ASCRUDRAFT_78100 [Ascoidea rubescens DSM 1968]ODV58199.1 hypothetical protein ASCRUDRAFT_78100 [Ascoidea rubescens DSM 1968]
MAFVLFLFAHSATFVKLITKWQQLSTPFDNICYPLIALGDCLEYYANFLESKAYLAYF